MHNIHRGGGVYPLSLSLSRSDLLAAIAANKKAITVQRQAGATLE